MTVLKDYDKFIKMARTDEDEEFAESTLNKASKKSTKDEKIFYSKEKIRIKQEKMR